MKVLLTFILLASLSSACFSQEPWKAPAEAAKLVNPYSVNDPKAIRSGQKVFGKICWTCHGQLGKGDGVAAKALNPKPADLSSHEIQKQPDGFLYWKITVGKGNMASYHELFSDKQRWQLVAFIRSLAN